MTTRGVSSRPRSAPSRIWWPTKRPHKCLYCVARHVDARSVSLCPPEVILACYRAVEKFPVQGNPFNMSAHMLSKAILAFYDSGRWPSGMNSYIPACKAWALKMGFGLKNLDRGSIVLLARGRARTANVHHGQLPRLGDSGGS